MEAVGVMYSLLQAHGARLAQAAAGALAAQVEAGCQQPGAAPPDEAGGPAGAAICAAAQAALAGLQGSVLLREALASAAVVLWSAACLPPATPHREALLLAQALVPDCLPPALHAAADSSEPEGLLRRLLAARGVDLRTELGRITTIARVCAVRGLLSAMSPQACCAALLPAGGGSSAVGTSSGGSGSRAQRAGGKAVIAGWWLSPPLLLCICR